MLANLSRVINMNAVSAVQKEDGSYDVIMAFSAYIQSDGKWNTTSSLENSILYDQNNNQVEADYAEFRKEVLRQAKTYKEKGEDGSL